MNKTIKIIDLLNKNANGEYPLFKWDNMVWKHDGEFYRNGTIILDEYANITTCLNETVKIIEDNDKLEKINITEDSSGNKFIKTGNYNYTIRAVDEYFVNKINGIMDHINKIEEKLDER